MTTSGFSVRVTGLVFFKSASLALKQVPTCIRKPKTNTFDKSIKFLHWLFFVVLDGFRSLQMVLGCFQIVLGRFSSSLTLVSTKIMNFLKLLLDRSGVICHICLTCTSLSSHKPLRPINRLLINLLRSIPACLILNMSYGIPLCINFCTRNHIFKYW